MPKVIWTELTDCVSLKQSPQSIIVTRVEWVRWTRLVRQFGGLAKVDRVRFYAANCSVISAIAWTSSGVLPAKVECGRRRL
ncbi:ComEC/Rec2 family competence protein [Nitrobacter sp. TKz-YC01]